jgi:hypothetical protein
MHLVRGTTILLVGLAIASAAPRQASAQSEFELDSDMTATPAVSAGLIEQRALAQAGLGQAFMFRLLQSHLRIGDTEDEGNIGKCKQLDHGGSVKLTRRVGTFVRQSTVEVYYDNRCKQVFIDSLLTVDEKTTNHFATVEAATFHKPPRAGKTIGPVTGKLNLTSIAVKTPTVVHLAGTGTWTPTGGTKVQGGLKCDYPRKLKGARPFTCSFAMAQPFNSLKMDVASATVLKFRVVDASAGTFNGVFSGPVQLFTGAFGKLSVAAPSNGPASILGAHKSLGTTTAKGSVPLMVFWPPPSSWTVTDALHAESFMIEMAKGLSRNSAGAITHTNKTLATFSVDKSGDGSITYSDRQTAKILNWLPGN